MQNQEYHNNLIDQTSNSSDIEDALTISQSCFKELENLLHFISQNYEESPKRYKLLARTGNHLIDQFIDLTESALKEFNEACSKFDEKTKVSSMIDLMLGTLYQIDYCSESLLKISTLLETIEGDTEKYSKDNKLASIGIYLAQDYSNMIDCMREEIQNKCGLKQSQIAA